MSLVCTPGREQSCTHICNAFTFHWAFLSHFPSPSLRTYRCFLSSTLAFFGATATQPPRTVSAPIDRRGLLKTWSIDMPSRFFTGSPVTSSTCTA